MAFINEISALANMTVGDNVTGYRVTLSDDNLVIVEGHKGLVAYADDVIKVRVKHKILILNGKNFVILSSSKDDLVIKGELTGVEVTQ